MKDWSRYGWKCIEKQRLRGHNTRSWPLWCSQFPQICEKWSTSYLPRKYIETSEARVSFFQRWWSVKETEARAHTKTKSVQVWWINETISKWHGQMDRNWKKRIHFRVGLDKSLKYMQNLDRKPMETEEAQKGACCDSYWVTLHLWDLQWVRDGP